MRKQGQHRETSVAETKKTGPNTIHVVTSNSSTLNSTADVLQRYAGTPNTPEVNAKMREMNGWLCIVRMGAVDNAIKPYPTQYFEQLAINAVDQAWEAGLQTLEERDQSVMKALVEQEIEYEKLLSRALKFARRDLPIALVPTRDQKALIAEAVHGAIEERYLPYIFADSRIRKFYDIVWPAIKQTLAEKLYVDCDPIDERRFMKWLLLPKPKKLRCKKTKLSKATTRSEQ